MASDLDRMPPGLRPLAELYLAVRAELDRVTQNAMRWIANHQEEIAKFVAGLEVLAEIGPELDRLYNRFHGSRWGHLLEELDFVSAVWLMLLLDQGEDEAVEQLLEEALTHDDFLDGLQERIAIAELPEPHRKQLTQGVEFVRKRDYALAVPMLMVPFEGVIYLEGEKRGRLVRVEDRMQLLTEDGDGKVVRSVEQVFKVLGLEQDYATFLRYQVYGGGGNPFRHGTALDGWRHRALSLVVALVSFLELTSEDEAPPLLAPAFARTDDAFESALDRLKEERRASMGVAA
jgi:hypothetical protein